MYRVVKIFLAQKWLYMEYRILWKYCIAVCNIFTWKGLILILESSGTSGGILLATEMVAPLVCGGNIVLPIDKEYRVSEGIFKTFSKNFF